MTIFEFIWAYILLGLVITQTSFFVLRHCLGECISEEPEREVRLFAILMVFLWWLIAICELLELFDRTDLSWTRKIF